MNFLLKAIWMTDQKQFWGTQNLQFVAHKIKGLQRARE
jgi:hypothetical protein